MDPIKLKTQIPGSDLRIDAEGHWFYRGREMVRRDIVRLFYRNLVRDEMNAYFIKIGPQTYPVEVEDTAYVVWSIRDSFEANRSEDCIDLMLSDDRTERLDPATLRIGKNNIPYCRILEGRFEARFSKPSYYQLAEHIVFNPQQQRYCLALNGRSYYISDI